MPKRKTQPIKESHDKVNILSQVLSLARGKIKSHTIKSEKATIANIENQLNNI